LKGIDPVQRPKKEIFMLGADATEEQFLELADRLIEQIAASKKQKKKKPTRR
jgi:hypothetical protein